MFFLHPPHSKIEFVLPLIGCFPPTYQVHRGLQPRVFDSPSIENVALGVDTFLKINSQSFVPIEDNNIPQD